MIHISYLKISLGLFLNNIMKRLQLVNSDSSHGNNLINKLKILFKNSNELFFKITRKYYITILKPYTKMQLRKRYIIYLT